MKGKGRENVPGSRNRAGCIQSRMYKGTCKVFVARAQDEGQGQGWEVCYEAAEMVRGQIIKSLEDHGLTLEAMGSL